ncbi:MAG: ferritin-like domain-containing protein [Mycobacterium sp.]
MTSPASPSSSAEPTPDPDRPEDAGPAALYDAVVAEHAAIYGYGLVSAHSLPTRNELISEAVAQHRDRREAALAMLAEQSAKAPLPAIGYELPIVVDSPTNAAKLAVRMEDDCAVAWRAVLEQTESEKDRSFAVTALTQCAVMAARWRKVLGAWPVTQTFPGGSE